MVDSMDSDHLRAVFARLESVVVSDYIFVPNERQNRRVFGANGYDTLEVCFRALCLKP